MSARARAAQREVEPSWVKLRRVQGTPPGIAALVARHGAVLGTYKRLPSFFERIGKPPAGGRRAT